MSPQCGQNVLYMSIVDLFLYVTSKLNMFNFWIHVESSTGRALYMYRQCGFGISGNEIPPPQSQLPHSLEARGVSISGPLSPRASPLPVPGC